MKKTGIVIFFIWFTINLTAQPSFFYHNQQIKEWYIESKKDTIQNEIHKVISSSEIKTLIEQNKINSDSLFRFFHYIDFNQDGLYDLIFNGKIGTKNHVIIYKKKVQGEYELALNQTGEILQTNLPNRLIPLSFSIWNPSCCAYKVNIITHWICIIKNGISYFEVQEQSLIYKNTVLPDVGSEVAPLEHFMIKNDVAKLRMSPLLDDETVRNGANDWSGNHVSYHPKGATGVIYSSFKDKYNVTWYFVKINTGSEYPTRSDRFKVSEEIENCEDYSYYGWIHGDNLKIIKP